MKMKFRKKPVVIEAFQYKKDVSFIDIPKWLTEAIIGGEVKLTNEESYVDTLEGRMTVSEDDYIIKGVEGELYPCKPNIFEATYEKVEEN